MSLILSVVLNTPQVLIDQEPIMRAEWPCEGTVVASVVSHLERDGWTIESIADTQARACGADICATRSGEMLIVEAKGYPTTVYARGAKKGMPKPIKPGTQARHWYSHALFDAMLRQSQYPSASVVIALPDFIVFKNLINRTQTALRKLSIGVSLVRPSGTVEVMSLNRTE